jgi:hypothetical protein
MKCKEVHKTILKNADSLHAEKMTRVTQQCKFLLGSPKYLQIPSSEDVFRSYSCYGMR